MKLSSQRMAIGNIISVHCGNHCVVHKPWIIIITQHYMYCVLCNVPVTCMAVLFADLRI